MKSFFNNKFLVFSVIGGIIVVVVIAFVLLSLTATTKAVVLNTDSSSGTTITEDMLKEIDVPEGTPGNFYKNKNALVGERLTSNVKAEQLLYESDIMSTIDVTKIDTNEKFITTSITLPNEQALGGLLTAGDTIDVSVVPDDEEVSKLSSALPEFKFDSGFTFILSNVTLLDTTTAVSSDTGSNMSSALNSSGSSNSSSSSSSSYYMISLSYNDYKKLMIAQEHGKIYFNLSPKQNKSKDPLLEEMTSNIEGGLSDASKHPDEQKSSNSSGSSTSKSSSALENSNNENKSN